MLTLAGTAARERRMTYKAYLDNIKAQTGKGPDYYLAEAQRLGLTTHAQLLKWLKADCGLGHGHANAMILYIRDPAFAKRKIASELKAGTKLKK